MIPWKNIPSKKCQHILHTTYVTHPYTSVQHTSIIRAYLKQQYRYRRNYEERFDTNMKTKQASHFRPQWHM